MKESLFHGQGQTLLRNWTNRVRYYLAGCLILGVLAVAGLGWLKFRLWFTPAQQFYYPDYVLTVWRKAVSLRGNGVGFHMIAVEDKKNEKGENIGRVLEPDDFQEVRFDGKTWGWFVEYDHEKYPAGITVMRVDGDNQAMYDWFKTHFYEDHSHLDLWLLPLVVGGLIAATVFGGVVAYDRQVALQRQKGKILRGVLPVTPAAFNSFIKGAGIGLEVLDGWHQDDLHHRTWKERLSFWQPKGEEETVIRLREKDLFQHIKVNSDTGTGKSQILMQFLLELQRLGLPAIVNDPDGLLASVFFRPERGDVILNPFDDRCPTWKLTDEIERPGDLRGIAESLFQEGEKERNIWFIETARDLFCELMKQNLTNEMLLACLCDENLIDQLTAGTPLASVLNKRAGPQRQGVLGTLQKLARVLEVVPPASGKRPSWSATRWARERKGWIFLTSRPRDREAVIPLHSTWIDLLIMRLMENQAWAVQHPVFFVMDELQSLNKLPKLERALTESRKYGVGWMLAYQGESQLKALYGDRILTMLSQAITKIMMRTSSGRAAEELSRDIGEAEIQREVVSTTEGVQDARDSTNISPKTGWERVVPPTLIQKLPDLEGFLTLDRYVTKFRIAYRTYRKVHPNFVERQETKTHYSPDPLLGPDPDEEPEYAIEPDWEGDPDPVTRPAGSQREREPQRGLDPAENPDLALNPFEMEEP